MKWVFTEDDVIAGRADYTLEQFRDDLRKEVESNFPEYTKDERETMFLMAYDVCYCLATHKDLQSLAEHWNSRGLSVDLSFIELLSKANTDNSRMLNALFAKKVSALLQSGMTRDEALKQLDAYHAQTIKR